jgi:hypothetical protein
MERDLPTVTPLLSAATGYSAPVVTATLEHMFRDWHAESLHTLLRAELGDGRALDQSIADPAVAGKQIAAFGFPLTFHVFSGNVPGVAVTSLVRALLVKSAALGKTGSGEPVLPVLFAKALAQTAPRVAECLAVTYWPGGSAHLDQRAAELADVLVLYGGSDAVRHYGALAAGRKLVVHGPRLSFGIVKDTTAATLPRDVAQSVAAYDQQGCVSPHLVYVVGDESHAQRFALAIAEELRTIEPALPRGRLTAEEAVAIRNARTAAEFGTDSELLATDADGFSVIYESSPEFRLSCLNRVLYVKPIAAARDILPLLPEGLDLQSVAMAGFPAAEHAELARALGRAGVSRITSFAALPWPPMHWHHDGSAPLRELIRWQDVEPGS